MKIAIASDHHGVEKRIKLIKYLKMKGYQVEDFGPELNTNVDYPNYAFKVSESVSNKVNDYGILMCGTGIGMSIASNKVRNIRCARIVNVSDAKLSKEHNNANVIAFSANIPFYKMKKMVEMYLNTKSSEEERHIKRVNMIDSYND